MSSPLQTEHVQILCGCRDCDCVASKVVTAKKIAGHLFEPCPGCGGSRRTVEVDGPAVWDEVTGSECCVYQGRKRKR